MEKKLFEIHFNSIMLFIRVSRDDFGIKIYTGSIIDERHIITSASVLYDELKLEFFKPEQIKVYLEIIDVNKVKNPYSVEKIIDENYRPIRWEKNIALLRLKDPLEFTRTLRPICVPRNLIPEDSNKTLNLTAVSFGGVEDGILKEGNFILRVKDGCKKLEEKCFGESSKRVISYNYDNEVCISQDEKNIQWFGPRDAGGPVQYWDGIRWNLMGINSHYSDGTCKDWSYFMNVYLTKADNRPLFESTPDLCGPNTGSRQ